MRDWTVCSIQEEDGFKFGLVLNVKVVLGTEGVGAGKMRTVEHWIKEQLQVGSAVQSSSRMLGLGIQPKPSKVHVENLWKETMFLSPGDISHYFSEKHRQLSAVADIVVACVLETVVHVNTVYTCLCAL